MAISKDLARHRAVITEALRVERARAGVTWPEICERLAASGILLKATNLRNKAARGQVEAALFLAILDTLGVARVSVPDYVPNLRDNPPKRQTARNIGRKRGKPKAVR